MFERHAHAKLQREREEEERGGDFWVDPVWDLF